MILNKHLQNFKCAVKTCHLVTTYDYEEYIVVGKMPNKQMSINREVFEMLKNKTPKNMLE